MKRVSDFLFPDIKDGDYTALTVILCVTFALWLFSFIFTLPLGFDKSKYIGNS